MKILNELQGYNGELNYCQLQQKLKEINDRENARFHKSYQMVPIFGFNQEKSVLHPLPKETLRRSYRIKTQKVKVNSSSMISFKSEQYSVDKVHIVV